MKPNTLSDPIWATLFEHRCLGAHAGRQWAIDNAKWVKDLLEKMFAEDDCTPHIDVKLLYKQIPYPTAYFFICATVYLHHENQKQESEIEDLIFGLCDPESIGLSDYHLYGSIPLKTPAGVRGAIDVNLAGPKTMLAYAKEHNYIRRDVSVYTSFVCGV